MARESARYWSMAQDVIAVLTTLGLSYYVVKYALGKVDLEAEDAKARRNAAAAVMQRIDHREQKQLQEDAANEGGDYASDMQAIRPRKEDLVLNQYEQTIATEVIAPEDIAVGFEEIGGLESVIEELKEAIIYPLTMPYLYSHSSSLLSAPGGALFYGPPGCGKTMLAKALAKESGANFINLHISTLTEKWYGDANKLVSAVFSLARKLQPTIVFIDEIDALLGSRGRGEHEATGMVKAEFMTLWDGLMTADAHGEQPRILILGATNRIQDIDEAILRRMPKKFPVDLPGPEQRRKILRLLLRDTKVDKQNFDLEFLTRVTDGLSGSGLKEACRDAAMVPVRECIRQRMASGSQKAPLNPKDIRGLRTDDFFRTAGGSLLQGHHAKQKPDGRRKSEVEEVEEVSDDDEEEKFEDPE